MNERQLKGKHDQPEASQPSDCNTLFAHKNNAMAMQTAAANILIGVEGWLVTDISFTISLLC